MCSYSVYVLQIIFVLAVLVVLVLEMSLSWNHFQFSLLVVNVFFGIAEFAGLEFAGLENDRLENDGVEQEETYDAHDEVNAN